MNAHAPLLSHPVPDVEIVREIVSAGILAPSPHNAQAWRLRWADGALECWKDVERAKMFLDFDNGATYVSFGAVVENVDIAARALGWSVIVEAFPEHDMVCRLRFVPEIASEDPLLPAIRQRVTNRRVESRQPLTAAESAMLEGAASERGGSLLLLHDRLAELGAMVGIGDRMCFVNERIHREIFEGIHFDVAEAERRRDGLDVRTLELSTPDRFAVGLIARPGVARFMQTVGLGAGMEQAGRKMVATASAMGLLVAPGTAPESYLQGGRALQRLWLTATAAGLSIHPLATLPYFFARAARGEGFSDAERSLVEGMRPAFLELFPVPDDHAEVLLFRVTKAGPPTARSLRRPVDDVLEIA